MPKKTTPSGSPEPFAGFPSEGLRFLYDLKENNDRDWFRERKHLYQELVHAPMERLVHAVAAGCRSGGLALHANERNPVMRVYRDIRFSANKAPYKTHVGASLTSLASKSAHGEMYLHIAPDEPFFAAGFWMPDRPFLNFWRQTMAENPRRFQRVLTQLAKAKLELSDEGALTRMPRGYDALATDPIAGAFKKSSFVVSLKLSPGVLISPKLVDEAVAFALQAKPLLEYGWSLNYAPPRDILE